MKLLVTGGAGFIGANFIRYWLNKYPKDRPGHDRRYAVDWSKLNRLDWRPKYTFDKGLKETVKWFKENEWWWRPLKEGSEKLYEKTGQK